MPLFVFDSKRHIADTVAEVVATILSESSSSSSSSSVSSLGPRILFPTGTTPLGEDGFFAALKRRREAGVETQRIRLVSGDEYYGVPMTEAGCFARYLEEKVMVPLGMDTKKALMLDGGVPAGAADAECERYEDSLRKDPLQLAVLGLGTNGHVAFNDPPSLSSSRSRILNLTEGSIKASQGDFPHRSPADLPTKALSIGIGTLLDPAICPLCIVMAVGEKKASIIDKVLLGEYVGPSCPASQMREASSVFFCVDTAAAATFDANSKAGSSRVSRVDCRGQTASEAARILISTGRSKKRKKPDESATRLIVAGDIGGTWARLRLWDAENIDSPIVLDMVEPMSKYNSLSEVAADCERRVAGLGAKIVKGCLAVCGPVWDNGSMNDPNNLWPGKFERSEAVAAAFGIPRDGSFFFVNDFESIGHSLCALSSADPLHVRVAAPQHILTIHHEPCSEELRKSIACVGAGTGLGVVFVASNPRGGLVVCPSEGGMSDTYSPSTDIEWGLKKFLMKKYDGYVEVERVVSGRGLVDVYEYCCKHAEQCRRVDFEKTVGSLPPDDRGSAISSAAEAFIVKGDYSEPSAMAMRLFLTAYGRFLQSSALQYLPYGGLYIAGGILPKLGTYAIQMLKEAYLDDAGEKVHGTVRKVPLHVINDGDTGIRGAVYAALTSHF